MRARRRRGSRCTRRGGRLVVQLTSRASSLVSSTIHEYARTSDPVFLPLCAVVRLMSPPLRSELCSVRASLGPSASAEFVSCVAFVSCRKSSYPSICEKKNAARTYTGAHGASIAPSPHRHTRQEIPAIHHCTPASASKKHAKKYPRQPRPPTQPEACTTLAQHTRRLASHSRSSKNPNARNRPAHDRPSISARRSPQPPHSNSKRHRRKPTAKSAHATQTHTTHAHSCASSPQPR